MNEIINLARIGLAGGREDLRAEIERLAAERERWAGHGITQSRKIDMGQRLLTYYLTRELPAKVLACSDR